MKHVAMQTPIWHRPPWLVILGAGLLAGTLVGCGKDGLERAIVRGTVTYQGQPLKEGEIRLVPRDSAKLPSSAGYIVDGVYTIDAKGGVPVGTYTIQVEAYQDLPETAAQKGAPYRENSRCSSRCIQRDANGGTQGHSHHRRRVDRAAACAVFPKHGQGAAGDL